MTSQPDRRWDATAAGGPAPAHRLRVLLLVAASILLLAACQARLVLDVSVAADGGGELRLSLTADEALSAEAAAAGVDPLADLADVGRELADDGWTVTEADAPDGGRTVTLAVPFADPEAFNALAATLADALAAPEVRLVERLTLQADGAELRLDGAVGARPGPAVTELGLEPAEAVTLVREHDAFVFDVTVSLPGELVATNAEAEDMPLRWRVPPGEWVEIVAVAERPPPRWVPVAAGAAGLLVVAAALAWGAVRRAGR